MRYYAWILIALLNNNSFGASKEDVTAFTQAGEEVTLKANGTWSYKSKPNSGKETVVRIGITGLEQRGEFCAIKYEVRNDTSFNFKSFGPNTHLVDKNGFRFNTSNIQIAIRPEQKSLTEVLYYQVTCREITKVEIDSFTVFGCKVYDKDGKTKEFEECEKLLASLPGTKVPVVIIRSK